MVDAAVIHDILVNPYVRSIIILIGVYIGLKFVYSLIIKYVKKFAEKTETEVDNLIIEGINRPVSLIILLTGIYFASLPFEKTFPYFWVIENIIASLTVLIITYAIALIVNIIIEAWGHKFAAKTHSEFDDQLIPLFHKFARIAILLIGVMFILPVWGIEIGPLLASLGIAGIAIAFALQATLSNIFGGVSLIMDKSIKVGDVIELDAQTMGTVVDVGLRSTRIKTWDNEIIIVPNGKVADSRIRNFIQPDPKVRVVVLFGVEYGSDVEHVKKVVMEVISKQEGILKDPEPDVLMLNMNDFSLDFRATVWVESFDDRFSTKCALTEKIYNALNANNIGIPFPTRTIHMKKEE